MNDNAPDQVTEPAQTPISHNGEASAPVTTPPTQPETKADPAPDAVQVAPEAEVAQTAPTSPEQPSTAAQSPVPAAPPATQPNQQRDPAPTAPEQQGTAAQSPVPAAPPATQPNQQRDPAPDPTSASPISESTPALDANMEAEIEAAMKAATADPEPAQPKPGSAAEHTLPRPEELKAAHDVGERKAIRGPRVVEGGREHRTGIVVSVGPTDIFIEFGPKELGVLARTQFKEGDELPKSGEEFEVVIDRFEASESLFICSRPGMVQKADWELLQPGQIVEARVTGFNKGGLELEVAKHRAFMPAGQIDTRRIEDFSVYVGEKMPVKVLRVDRSGRGNITLSRRDLIAGERKKQAEELKEKLKVGQTIEGVVKKIMPFGAFVDMGGLDGLLHISDLSHERVGKVESVVKEGETVKVQILRLDWENGRHSLGLKQLQEDPWAAATSDVKEGEEVSGTVTKMMEFGAFVEVAPGIEGLVHISELSWQRVAKTSDVVQPGKVVKVKVIKLDSDTKKISLSMKQCSDMPKPKGMKQRGGGRGRGDKMERDTRTPDEILKETPALRRAREKAKLSEKQSAGLKPGLGQFEGSGLSDLKLPG